MSYFLTTGGVMNRKIYLAIGILAILPLISACAATYIPTENARVTTYRLSEEVCCGPTRVEMDFGTSHRLSKFNQKLNPEAENSTEPVPGLEGRTSEIIVDKYQKSFEKEKQKPTYNINIGSMN
jgi:hypothetical protein